jgi:hypothetical protein
MQFTKDSFYMALLERLMSLNPLQTITLNGATRPAVVVAENELVTGAEPVPDAFYIEWGAAQPAPSHQGRRGLMQMECVISYHTLGTVDSGVDRGRTLGKLDMQLLSICHPPRTAKRDYTRTPSVDLGTSILWTTPDLSKVSGVDGAHNEGLLRGSGGVRLERSASLKVFFFPEVNFL